jgi:hypothetical protein
MICCREVSDPGNIVVALAGAATRIVDANIARSTFGSFKSFMITRP